MKISITDITFFRYSNQSFHVAGVVAVAELSMGRLDQVQTRPEPENANLNPAQTQK